MNCSIAENINLLAGFLGMRDVPALTPECLKEKYGMEQADVMVLFGGSILCGGDVLAQAMRDGAARRYIIVGGEGHTTQTLRDKMHALYPECNTAGMPEAQVFQAYLQLRHGLHADFLECKSTNCGNNITHLLSLLQEQKIPCKTIILCQDASMQRRMDAGLRKYADLTIINFAAYAAEISMKNGRADYSREILGMWDMERYIQLLMGEIPRLRDDENGYGPQGKNFIAHVDIPPEVQAAFDALCKVYENGVREANPLYATQA